LYRIKKKRIYFPYKETSFIGRGCSRTSSRSSIYSI